ncbi:Cu-processing system permease protein [Melghiribacillus thermohalophilus]|uniref:Cu-processing system permease protein n=1 Tax=Melghiribacillus thermohalophilus TaxID=1324956 RepID=A0A4R3NGD2_9BACI|nr:ABC transporter permease [Melghiribacillus thermohalophilus]TCT26333.1 Cu-processing system permease protein [Melghiribacillus thermohalophilus]
MDIFTIMKNEIKLGFRNPWAYSFLAIFTLVSLSLLFIQSGPISDLNQYTKTTGTFMNLILYLLPLMTLLLGALSITSEKEDGRWNLLSTYPLSSFAFIAGKYAGMFIVLSVIISFGFGLSGLISAFMGQGLSFYTVLWIFIFSILLILLFLGMAVWIGAVSKNRWQALTISVGIWFLLVLAWPILLIAGLSQLPYASIQPTLEILIFFNPAELVRIFVTLYMGGGHIFGPEYYQWIEWFHKPAGALFFMLVCMVWVLGSVGLTIWKWERNRRHV